MDTKKKVTARLAYQHGSLDPSSTTTRYHERPPSPLKRQMSPSPRAPVKVKAKVNSSATPNSLAQKPPRITTAVARTPRAGSPAGIKPSPRLHGGTTQPRARPMSARPAARAPPMAASSSTPGTPSAMYHGLSKTPSLDSPSPVNTSPHRRASSVSLLHDYHSLAIDSDIRDATHGDVGPKIKAKISKLVQHSESLAPSSRQGNIRTRAPSVSSSTNASSTPDHTFYPITTATPAANPYRYGSGRAHASPPSHHSYQPFPPDPAAIPLPPNSPPTSALSFSSRSSVSRSSHADSGDSALGAANTSNLRSALDTLMQFSSETEDDDFSEDSAHSPDTDTEDMTRKVRAVAKTNRKIEDLEISNRSLLAINVTLEATKHRQAKEIRDLKRRLRESRLILPPRTYRAVKSSMDFKEDDTDDDDEDEAGEAGDEESMTKGDESYKRVKALLDALVQSGKHALETEPLDFLEQKAAAKVLSAEEVRDWETPDESLQIDDDESRPHTPPPVRNGGDNDDEGLDSEDEVAAMTLLDSDPPSPAGPPILVTESL